MSDYFNGLDDFQPESAQSTFGRFVLGAMLALFAAASMLTTFGFFATYAPGLGAVIHEDYGAYIAGALGVLLFDLAGLGWTVLRAHSDTTRQFVIATVAAIVTIALALLTSALQVLLSSSFDVGLYLADGSLSEFGYTIQLTGVIVMTLGFVLNFAAIAAYVNTSRDVTAAVQAAQLRAYMAAGRFAADQARAQLVTRQTVSSIMRQLPEYAARAAQQNSAEYVTKAFVGLPRADDGGGMPPHPLSRSDTLEEGMVEEGMERNLMDVDVNSPNSPIEYPETLEETLEEGAWSTLVETQPPGHSANGSGDGSGENFPPRPGGRKNRKKV